MQRESLFVAASIAVADHDSAQAATAFRKVLQLDGFFEGIRRRNSRAPLLDLTRITLGRGGAREALELALALRRLDLVDSLAAVRRADVGQADLLVAQAYLALGRRDSALAYARGAATALATGLGASSTLAREAADLLASLEQ